MIKEIFSITLDFPHGASVKQCQKILNYAQAVVQAGVSEGGFMIKGSTPDGEGIVFSEDELHYVFGHDKSNSDEKKSLRRSTTEGLICGNGSGTEPSKCVSDL